VKVDAPVEKQDAPVEKQNNETKVAKTVAPKQIEDMSAILNEIRGLKSQILKMKSKDET
jgi:hypothetical protein